MAVCKRVPIACGECVAETYHKSHEYEIFQEYEAKLKEKC